MSEERLPPHDIEAEEALLGSMLLDASQLGSIDLAPGDFFDEVHCAIFEAMLNLRKRDEGVDQITVAHELLRMGKLEQVDGAAYLSRLISITPTSLHAQYYAKVVKDCAVNRSLIAAAGEIAAAAYAGGDPAEAISSSRGVLNRVGRMITNQRLLTPMDLANRAHERYEVLRHTTPGLKTGVKALDNLTGGLSGGDYSILASRPGMGKTTFALQMAVNIALERTVLFVSLEMMPEAVIDKMVAGFAGVPVRVVRRGNYPDAVIDAIVVTYDKLTGLKLYLSYGPATVGSLRQVID